MYTLELNKKEVNRKIYIPLRTVIEIHWFWKKWWGIYCL